MTTHASSASPCSDKTCRYNIIISLQNEDPVFQAAQSLLDALRSNVKGTLAISFDGERGTFNSETYALPDVPPLAELQPQTQNGRAFCLLGEVKIGLKSIISTPSPCRHRLLILVDPSRPLEEALCQKELAELNSQVDQGKLDFKLILVSLDENNNRLLKHLRAQGARLPQRTYFKATSHTPDLLDVIQ